MPRNRRDKSGGAKMDSLYNSAEFRMNCFKVLPCSKHYCHDWTECPFAHPGEKARRRDPRVFRYVGIECPQVKEGGKCPRGDLCPFAHNVFECWLHPTRYRTQLCNEPASCKRKVCFFAHSVEELREPTTGLEHLVEGAGGSAPGAASPAPRPVDQRPSMDERRSSGGSPVAASPGWSATDAQTAQQKSPQEAALLAAALMQLQNGQPNNTSTDIANPLEQLAMMQAGGSPVLQTPTPPGVPGAPAANNDRVMQLLVLLLKEIAHARHNQGQQHQQHRRSLEAAALASQAQRNSLDSALYGPPGTQPHHRVPRMSLEALRRMSFTMLSNAGKGAGGEGSYMRAPSMGRISLDGNTPDFVLHDTRARAPSMDSNMSETLNMARAGRMSVDSSSSFLSGGRRSIEMGADTSLLRMAGLAGDPTGVVADALARRYEPPTSVEATQPGGYLYKSSNGVLHVQANSFPAAN